MGLPLIHSLTHIVTHYHYADLPLIIFEKMPLNLMIFATHFHSYRLRGCEIWAHPEYLGFQITHFEKIWLESQQAFLHNNDNLET